MSSPEQITIPIAEWEVMPEAWRSVFTRAVERRDIELDIPGAEPISEWLKGFCEQRALPILPPQVLAPPRLLWTDGKFEARLGDEVQEAHDVEREEMGITPADQDAWHNPRQVSNGGKL